MAGSPQIPVRDRIAAGVNLARFVRTDQKCACGTDAPARGSLTHPCHTGRFTTFSRPLLLERGPVMARSKNDSGSGSSDKTAANLTALRGQIDRLDLQILELVNKRAGIAAQIGKVKADQGGEVFSAAREEQVLDNVLKAHEGPLDAVTIRAIFRELISGSRAIQKQQKIAYLGPEYSYSHLAAIQRFGEASVYNRTANIAAVFEEVIRKHADFGVVPLENSTDGRIVDTLDMFIRSPGQVKICSEIRLRVRHHLLANCKQAEVQHVYSKAQALSQCRD